jgi:hypothetical protein
VANTIDIYHEDCIQSFIKDGKLNIDTLLRHNLTKITIVYHTVWNHLYGTWASKKDVKSFYDDVLNIKQNYHNFDVTLDTNFLNAIIAHEPFVLARMGAVHRSNSLRDVYVSVVTKFNDPFPIAFICDCIQQRWKYRYNASDVDMMSQNTMLKTFVKYQLRDVASLTEDCQVWCNVTKYVAECRELNDVDFKYMNRNEVIQYHVYRDNRFMLQLASQVIVVVDGDVGGDDIHLLVNSVHQHLKKNVVMLKITGGDDVKHSHTSNVRFKYDVDRCVFHLLPKIATKLYLVSNSERVTMLNLCTLPAESFLITNNDRLSVEQKSHFSFLMTLDKDKTSPSDSIYFMPSMNISHNGDVYSDIVVTAMGDYFTQRCPFQTNNARNNGLQYANFITRYISQNFDAMISGLKDYKHDTTDNKSKHVIVASVDNRFNALTFMAVLVSLWNITKHKVKSQNDSGDVWYSGVIYSSKEGCHKYKQLIESMGLYSLVTVRHWKPFDDIAVFHMEDYNAVMKDGQFWRSLKGDVCIIVQDDGYVVNGKGMREYLDYDYVGAPWVDGKENAYIKQHINHELVGNGGFSLRNVAKMIEVCEACDEADKNALFYYNINEMPEDVFFVKHLRSMKANIAPFEVARRFSVEQVLTNNPIGFHKFWLYNLPTNVDRLFESFLR